MASDLKELGKLYNEFGKDFVKILVRELKRAGKDSSGALINSVNYKIKDIAKNAVIQIEANDYLTYVDEGRKKGSYPPIGEIKKWLSLKGIPQGAAFPISRKIFEFGIKPTNVIDKTIREFQTSSTLLNKYENEAVNIIENEIVNMFKKIK